MASSNSPQDVEIREGMDDLTATRIATLYRRAALLRPTGDREAVISMFERSQLVLTAWQEERLVGVARVLTDEVMYSLLADLAVDPDVQGHGLGKRLIDEVIKRTAGTELLLRDSSLSAGFYRHLGFDRVENAWVKRV